MQLKLNPTERAITAQWFSACTGGPENREDLAVRLGLDDRLMRLAAAAFVRDIWHLVENYQYRAVVEVVEALADGTVELSSLASARSMVGYLNGGYVLHVDNSDSAGVMRPTAYWAVRNMLSYDAGLALTGASIDAAYAPAYDAGNSDFIRELACRSQGMLVAGIVGPGWDFDPSWRTDAAVAVASAVYDNHAFFDMPILADALEDAGCREDDLIAGLRCPARPWCRGARILDHLIGLRPG